MAATPEATEATVAEPTPRGLWVLCQGSQRVLDDATRIPRLIEQAQALGATDLFVQVYRGGRAWFDSSLADAGPWQKAVEASGGVDPLASLLEQANAAGLRVHAWVNVLNLATNARAPIIDALGRGAVLVDQAGRSVLDYPDYDIPSPDRAYYRMGTPGIWLDPAAPGVAARLTETFRRAAGALPRARRAASRLHPLPGRAALRAGLPLRRRPRHGPRRRHPRALPPGDGARRAAAAQGPTATRIAGTPGAETR